MPYKPMRHYPRSDQMDPEGLTTETVQLWHNGCLSRTVNLQWAKEAVRNRRAFVICSQAIGALHDDGYSIS